MVYIRNFQSSYSSMYLPFQLLLFQGLSSVSTGPWTSWILVYFFYFFQEMLPGKSLEPWKTFVESQLKSSLFSGLLGNYQIGKSVLTQFFFFFLMNKVHFTPLAWANHTRNGRCPPNWGMGGCRWVRENARVLSFHIAVDSSFDKWFALRSLLNSK